MTLHDELGAEDYARFERLSRQWVTAQRLMHALPGYDRHDRVYAEQLRTLPDSYIESEDW